MVCGGHEDCNLDCDQMEDGEQVCSRCANERFDALKDNTPQKVMDRIRGEIKVKL